MLSGSDSLRGPSYPTTPAPSTIPDELAARPRWVCWRYNADKTKKPPVDPVKGRFIDWTRPDNWLSFGRAVAAAEEHDYGGVGFVLTPDDPFSFIDLDGVVDPETGGVEPWAMEIVEAFSSYTEISPSGTGLRIALLGKMPFKKAGTKPVELFSKGGYVTITGRALPGYDGPIAEAQDALEDLHEGHRVAEPFQTVEDAPREPLREPVDLSDAELLEKARGGRYGREFVALFDAGDTSAFGGDESRADNALAVQLAFWTAKDPDRMERLMGLSALGRRDKWKARPDYRRRTINRAVKRASRVYEPELHRPEKTRTRDRIREIVAYAVLAHPWKENAGRADAGATDFFGYLGLLRTAHRANTFEIDVSVRDYMEAAGISDFTTALRSLARLENPDLHRLVEKIRDGGGGGAARYRIRAGSKPKHIEIPGGLGVLDPPCVDNVCAGLSIPLAGAHLIRNASPEMPEYDKNGRKIPKGAAPLVKSVGKSAAMVAYVVASCAPLFGGVVPASFVALRTGISVKNLKARHAKKLSAAGLVETVEGSAGYAPPEDADAALKEELRVSGSLAAANHQRRRHDRQRRVREIKRLAWLGHDAEGILSETGYDPDEIAAVVTPHDPAPTEAEMEARRIAKSATGTYSELERAAEHFEGTYTADHDPQHPIGHDYPEPPPEALQEPVTAPQPVPKAEAPPDDASAVEGRTEAPDGTPCKHSGLGVVFPGGRGCYLCDKNHPLRVQERERGVLNLEEYRQRRAS